MTYTANTITGSNDVLDCVVTWSYTANAGSITITVASYNNSPTCKDSGGQYSNGAVGTAYTGTYSISGSTLTAPFKVGSTTYTFTGTKSTSTVNMAGTWIGAVSYTNASNESVTLNPITFAITQSGTNVTGTWTFPAFGAKTLSGTVNNSILAATMADTACTLNSGSITADLTLNANKLVVTSFASGSKVCSSTVQDSAVTAFRGSLTKQ